MARFIILVIALLVGLGVAAQFDAGASTEERRDLYLRQLRDDDRVPTQIRTDYNQRNTALAVAGGLWVALAGSLYAREIGGLVRRGRPTGSHPVA